MEKSYSATTPQQAWTSPPVTRSVRLMKQYVARTMNEHCIGGLGGFGGLFELDCTGYKRQCLRLRHRRRGRKLKIAMMDKHDTIGIDCVCA